MVFVEAPLPPPSLSYEDGGNGDSNHTITMVVADVHSEPPLSGWWLARILLRWRRKIDELPRHVIYVIGAAAIVGTGYIIYLLVKRRRRPRDARPPLPGNGGQPPPGGDHPQAPKLKHLPDDRAASDGDDAEYDEDQGPGDGDETGGEGSAAYGLHDIAAFAVAFSNSPTGPTLAVENNPAFLALQQIKVAREICNNKAVRLLQLLNPEKSHFSIPWFERLTIFDVCPRPNLVESTSGSRDLQMVRPGLGVLTRPLPTKYRSLGDNFCERVLTSLMHETLKAVVAQYNASQLIIPREFKSFRKEFTHAIETKQVDEQEAQRAKFIVEKAEQHKRKAVITEQACLNRVKLRVHWSSLQLEEEELGIFEKVIYLTRCSHGSRVILDVGFTTTEENNTSRDEFSLLK
uniref:Band 7 domain-containing protein n=1 Tax=Oryza glumipatula TaxID=40148 RepID=A0A0D9ZEV9_9ORYZ